MVPAMNTVCPSSIFCSVLPGTVSAVSSSSPVWNSTRPPASATKTTAPLAVLNSS